ncbi:MAG: TonB-dependent receptor [Bacteroidia bacterium]|nr:TonB-dependent receptor [Bacteroidia bacterium]
MYNFFKTTVLLLITISSVKAQTDTSKSKNELQESIILGIKATRRLPVTYTILNRKEIEDRYYGADLPSLINSSPGVNSYSDNGTGIGYSYFRLRGIDQTRINTTINGIPVNDPENQGVFFNNFADLATSAESIQIQRGVGTSTNGSSAFGGSINLLTKNLSQTPEVKVSAGIGSYNASRIATELQSGIVANHFMFYGRYSELKTNGFREHSGASIQSYTFSGAFINKRSVIKLNLFGGNAQNQLSYTGLTKANFEANNKANDFTNGETDAFKQQFYQLQYSLQISHKQTLSASVYFVKGNAPKFQYLFPGSWGLGFNYFNMPNAIIGSDTITTAGDMMTSYRVNQHFSGGFLTYNYHNGKVDLTTGLHANSFVSDHFMEVNWGNIIPAGVQQNHQVYFNTGYKKEASIFTKLNYYLTEKINIFADLQMRFTGFSYRGKSLEIKKDTFQVEPMNWTFFNPKIGARFSLTTTQAIYIMAGISSREPTRFDYFQDDFATKGNTRQNDIKAEKVFNVELGHEINTRKIQSKINLYAMEFSNQIVGLGQLNNFGYQITGNVGKSFRRGLELDFNWIAIKNVHVFMSSAISINQINVLNQHFTSVESGNDTLVIYKNTVTGFSPSVIQNIGLRVLPASWFSADFIYRYVDKQYLDNTQNANLSVPSFNLFDVRLALQLKQWIKAGEPVLRLQINNVGDVKYAPTGSLGGVNTLEASGKRGNNSLYFPAAGRNIFITLSWKF